MGMKVIVQILVGYASSPSKPSILLPKGQDLEGCGNVSGVFYQLDTKYQENHYTPIVSRVSYLTFNLLVSVTFAVVLVIVVHSSLSL